MSHTPGPWTVLYGGHGTDGYFVIASRGGDTLICDSSPRQLLPEAELNANARLIAAAPDMQQSLIRMQRLLRLAATHMATREYQLTDPDDKAAARDLLREIKEVLDDC